MRNVAALAYVFTGFLAFSAGPGLGATVTFTPPNVNEHQEDDVLDDDLDVTADMGLGNSEDLAGGDTGTWDYVYKRPYKVLSDDKADLELVLSLLPGLGAGGTIESLTFYLTSSDGEIPGTRITAGPTNFIGTTATISFFGDDVLGNLQGKTITDFHLEFKLSSGFMRWHDASVLIEADDIEPVPLPPALLSLMVPILVLGGLARRKARHHGG